VIRIDGLARGFDDQMVLRDFSLSVDPGERLLLHGPNGAVKTTLLRCILGTLVPDAGSVMIAGHAAGSVAARALVGASLSQERSFYMRLTGFENLLLYARVRGLSKRAAAARVRTVADELELGQMTKRRADRCSTGQLQQLAFARTLVGEPGAILLDEPTRSLDEAARERTWSALDRRPDAAVIIASHLDEDAGRATRILDVPLLRGPT
jgi:ABC-type multidrug transport system ATPase subunit